MAGRVYVVGRGYVWQGVCVCVWQGACAGMQGGMHGGGAHMTGGMHGGGGGHAWQEKWPLQREVRILMHSSSNLFH